MNFYKILFFPSVNSIQFNIKNILKKLILLINKIFNNIIYYKWNY